LIYLKNSGQEEEFYKDVVAPFLEDPKEMKPLVTASNNNFQFEDCYYTRLSRDLCNKESNMNIIKLLLNFAHAIVVCDQDVISSLGKFVDLAITHLKEWELHELLELILLDYVVFEPLAPFKKLIKHRILCLRELTRNPPIFCWSMPRAPSFLNHPEFDEFIRSERPAMVYSGGFSRVKEAQDFVKRFGGVRFNYSTNMVYSGIGKNASVQITKTSDYFERVFMVYSQRVEELHRLEVLLNN
jgi:hypothetical protein